MVEGNTVLLTGANGFIGSQIARKLLDKTNFDIISLVKARNDIEAKNRLSKAWWEWPDLHNSLSSRVKPLAADIRKENLGISEQLYKELAQNLTYIIHCAAKWRFDTPLEELRQTNVQGTANIIDLAKSAHENHCLSRLSHVSTAYVSGNLQGTISEDTLTDRFGFITDYERSKYEGEKLVQSVRSRLPISIFRPSMVVGDSNSGEIKTFNTIYSILRLYLKGKIRFLPMNPLTKINIVPVDYVANTIIELTLNNSADGLTFHLTPRYNDLPTARELASSVHQWAYEKLNISLPQINFISMPKNFQKILFRTWGKFTNNSKYTRLMEAFSSYFRTEQIFLRNNVEKLTSEYQFNWLESISPILEYAVKYGFLHKSERTVHEQILFRLDSKSMPVSLFDIIQGRIIRRSNRQVKNEILAISHKLLNMGIKKGDTIALVGLNSVRYLALDVAIGLVGAVSVPLYYTSTPIDIEKIAKASNAKILFVGTPRILERISEINLSIPIVSFCNEPLTKENRNVLSWKEFISHKQTEDEPKSFPSLVFSDLSTIRYTAGSTGENKGVCFNHANIRWLAETVGSLFPWKVRNKQVTYLSFLPLNHVVEGILGAYSPFYEPTEVKLYFLENFYELQEALPKVRPAVFFSVPRFYEKVWNSFKKSRLGIEYLNSSSQLKKSVLRGFLRRTLLKRAGLDKCVQLIVGSAPSNEKLLLSYRDLGIEVHNAYGLTEAPLVTMNRLGKNHIGTVGQPLPKTELKQAKDEELLVKGPQVMKGYLNENKNKVLEDGWLHTGDLGRINENGDLVIYGRKKEVIATSYGKKISIFKIESMLKTSEGVNEVMLIGEGKPYVAALIWSNQAEQQPSIVKSIEKGLTEVNNNLSRAEKIRSWIILKNDLGVESGDLTPNFKLKRHNISTRFAIIIDSLYNSKFVNDPRIIHSGRIKI